MNPKTSTDNSSRKLVIQGINYNDLTYKQVLTKLMGCCKLSKKEIQNELDYINDLLIQEKKKVIFRHAFL